MQSVKNRRQNCLMSNYNYKSKIKIVGMPVTKPMNTVIHGNTRFQAMKCIKTVLIGNNWETFCLQFRYESIVFV